MKERSSSRTIPGWAAVSIAALVLGLSVCAAYYLMYEDKKPFAYAFRSEWATLDLRNRYVDSFNYYDCKAQCGDHGAFIMAALYEDSINKCQISKEFDHLLDSTKHVTAPKDDCPCDVSPFGAGISSGKFTYDSSKVKSPWSQSRSVLLDSVNYVSTGTLHPVYPFHVPVHNPYAPYRNKKEYDKAWADYLDGEALRPYYTPYDSAKFERLCSIPVNQAISGETITSFEDTNGRLVTVIDTPQPRRIFIWHDTATPRFLDLGDGNGNYTNPHLRLIPYDDGLGLKGFGLVDTAVLRLYDIHNKYPDAAYSFDAVWDRLAEFQRQFHHFEYTLDSALHRLDSLEHLRAFAGNSFNGTSLFYTPDSVYILTDKERHFVPVTDKKDKP